MKRLGIREDEILEKFILGSGPGGQKIQKSHSCVYLKHLPTGIEVKCQKDRSRALNRFYARRELCEKIEEKVHKQESAKEKEAAKIRKQKQRRARRTQQKLIEEKRERSEKKSLRKPPSSRETES